MADASNLLWNGNPNALVGLPAESTISSNLSTSKGYTRFVIGENPMLAVTANLAGSTWVWYVGEKLGFSSHSPVEKLWYAIVVISISGSCAASDPPDNSSWDIHGFPAGSSTCAGGIAGDQNKEEVGPVYASTTVGKLE